MKAKIIKIGNSKGLRLSKTILERYEINDKVEIVLEPDHIVLKPIVKAREGWKEQFEKMHELGDDKLIIKDVFEEEEFEEWN